MKNAHYREVGPVGIFYNEGMAWTLTLLGLALVVVAVIGCLGFLIELSVPKSITISAGVLAITLCLFAFVCHTHRVVGVNERAIVINRWSGQIVGDTRPSGTTTIPFLSGRVLSYPAEKSHEKCDDFTPSVQGGYEIKTHICFYFDASTVDWVNQFRRYNQSYTALSQGPWKNQLSPQVALATRNYIPSDLTNQRDKVTQDLFTTTGAWFKGEGITLNSIVLQNWDFTDAKIRDQYNQTIASQNQTLVYEQQLVAAQKQRDLQLYQQETKNEVLAAAARGELAYLNSLGVTDPDTIARILTIQYLQNLPTPPQNVILSTGGNVPPSAPTK
jgi:hypothetical protein